MSALGEPVDSMIVAAEKLRAAGKYERACEAYAAAIEAIRSDWELIADFGARIGEQS